MADFHVGELAHAHMNSLILRHSHGCVGMEEKPVIWLVCLGLLSGDDEVDWDADSSDRSGNQVVIGVADDGEPVARVQAIQRGRHFGMRFDPPQDRQQHLLVVHGGGVPDLNKCLVQA